MSSAQSKVDLDLLLLRLIDLYLFPSYSCLMFNSISHRNAGRPSKVLLVRTNFNIEFITQFFFLVLFVLNF